MFPNPKLKRIPVGYHRDFLENYRPNVDNYLTSEDKDRLVKIGKTQGDNQPAGTYAQQILNRLLIDLSWNSSHLEGNTYSLLDTELLIYEGKPAGNKSPKETQMIFLRSPQQMGMIPFRAACMQYNLCIYNFCNQT
ncbi:Fic family protein [Sinomicrobium oceani]|uniref:hypothetical protein n=1 Tax=Sinomicrobium oceani TaxID=1150368 RepID=UPI000930FCCA|nr:hypothetical protein [Sinomicrobium oceani]